MNKDVIREAVVSVLTEIQINGGYPKPSISGDTCPVTGLAGFDSLNAVEASHLLSDRLNCQIAPNFMFSNNYSQPLTVDEIVDCVDNTISKQGERAHGQFRFR